MEEYQNNIVDAIVNAVRTATSNPPPIPTKQPQRRMSLYQSASALAQPRGASIRGGGGRGITSSSTISISQPGSFTTSAGTNATAASSSSNAVGLEDGKRKRKFFIPSIFQSKRSNNKKGNVSGSKEKSVKYIRDIFCLPQNLTKDDGVIPIPRGSRRSALANASVGLFGKIEFNSTWSPEEMRKEICSVFAKPFKLSMEDIAGGTVFPFQYLQRTGAGSRSLCIPTVTESFQWNGRQVATLAKSGGCIYILANKDIPVLEEMICSVSLTVISDMVMYLQ